MFFFAFLILTIVDLWALKRSRLIFLDDGRRGFEQALGPEYQGCSRGVFARAPYPKRRGRLATSEISGRFHLKKMRMLVELD